MAPPIEAEEIFEASSKSLRQLLSENGLGFYIPPYQRSYSWNATNVDKLLDDTISGLGSLVKDPNSFTFLGTVIVVHDTQYATVQPIVKADVPGKVLIVIDGQQRLSTLMLITVVLHNQLRLKLKEVAGYEKFSEHDAQWFVNEAKKTINQLSNMIFENQNYGESPVYPRLIRAYDDSWSTNPAQAKYESPISHIIASYVSSIGDIQRMTDGPAIDFKPKPRVGILEGEAAVIDRYHSIRRFIIGIANGIKDDRSDHFPQISDLTSSTQLQKSLLNQEISASGVSLLEAAHEPLLKLMRLLMLASYFKDRVAVTRVKGKDENYAFAIFESLNTTGEPLTAFETFKPRVVLAEGLDLYGGSKSRGFIDDIAKYLETFALGNPVQNATKELIGSFALAETGAKLSNQLTDQRIYLRDEFQRHSAEPAARLAFVQHFSQVADFTRGTWPKTNQSPSLIGFQPDATTDSIKLCMDFLRQLGHTVTLAPLSRFYADALARLASGDDKPTESFAAALKAITAFSVIWRSTHRGTANIDREYREIMSGTSMLTDMLQLARTPRISAVPPPPTEVNHVRLKAELLARLAGRGGVPDRESFVDIASKIPLYKYPLVARFLLLSAHDDAVMEKGTGLITSSKKKFAQSLNYKSWLDEDLLTLEHVAPQGGGKNWPGSLFEDNETIDRIGNLVLVPAKANSSLSNREWEHKRILYKAFGSETTESARIVLEEAAELGVTFADSTNDLVLLSTHTPQLRSLGDKEGEWDAEFIDRRGRRLLGLAWDRISPWLS